jgi:hypothetical protein
MPEEVITLEFLSRLCQQLVQETGALRGEVREVRTLSLQTVDYARRIERRVSEQRDDLELMIKAELSGGLAHMQTQLEHHLRPIHDRLLDLDRLEARVSALEAQT